MWKLAGNQQAWTVMSKMVDYFVNWIHNVVNVYGVHRWNQMLYFGVFISVLLLLLCVIRCCCFLEFGGLNMFMYTLYEETQNMDHLWMAHVSVCCCSAGLFSCAAEVESCATDV